MNKRHAELEAERRSLIADALEQQVPQSVALLVETYGSLAKASKYGRRNIPYWRLGRFLLYASEKRVSVGGTPTNPDWLEKTVVAVYYLPEDIIVEDWNELYKHQQRQIARVQFNTNKPPHKVGNTELNISPDYYIARPGTPSWWDEVVAATKEAHLLIDKKTETIEDLQIEDLDEKIRELTR